MSSISALANVHLIGQFRHYEGKNESNLLKITEIKNLLIAQIVQYKDSTVSIDSIDIDGLKFKDEPLRVANNDDTRVLWNGPKNWLVVSTKKNLFKFKKKLTQDEISYIDNKLKNYIQLEISSFQV